MSYPSVPGKHRFEALVKAEEMVAHRRRAGSLGPVEPPRGVILCLERGLPERMRWRIPIRRVGRLMGDLYAVRRTRGRVLVLTGFGIGAPVIAAQAEELIALGARRLVSIALAGGIQPDLSAGDVVVCDRAIRDEGTSHHYLPPSSDVCADPRLVGQLADALRARGRPARIGASWSTDAPFRETREEIAHFQAAGVLTAELEVAGLLAVAQVRHVAAAAVLVVADSLAGSRWEPPERSDGMAAAIETAYRAAIEVLDGA